MREFLSKTKTFWTTEANHKRVVELGDGPVRPYPYTFMTPITALSVEGEGIVLHPRARRITLGCNLAAVLSKTGKFINPKETDSYILEYRILVTMKDWFWLDAKPHKTDRDIWAWGANYASWTDGFNCVSQAAVAPGALAKPYDRKMWLSVDGVGEVTTSTSSYLHGVADIFGYLSSTITFREGDIIALGRAGEALTIPADRLLPAGTMLRAEIDGIGKMATPIIDQRKFD